MSSEGAVSNKQQFVVGVNCHGGLFWTLLDTITWDEFCSFIAAIREQKFQWVSNKHVKKTDVEKFPLLVCEEACQIFSEKISPFLQQTNENSVTVLGNSYIRLLIRLFGRAFGLMAKTKVNTETIRVPCSSFLPCNQGVLEKDHELRIFSSEENDFVCGCEYAPAWFQNAKNRHNNYDDTFCYASRYQSTKIGVTLQREPAAT